MIQNNLKKLMKKRKVTQVSLAKAVGVSHRTVVYWYSNKFQPKTKYWEKILQVLKCDVKDLF